MKPTIEIPPPTFLTGKRLFVLVLLALLVFAKCAHGQKPVSFSPGGSGVVHLTTNLIHWTAMEWDTNCLSENFVSVGYPLVLAQSDAGVKVEVQTEETPPQITPMTQMSAERSSSSESAQMVLPSAGNRKLESPRGAETFRGTLMRRRASRRNP